MNPGKKESRCWLQYLMKDRVVKQWHCTSVRRTSLILTFLKNSHKKGTRTALIRDRKQRPEDKTCRMRIASRGEVKLWTLLTVTRGTARSLQHVKFRSGSVRFVLPTFWSTSPKISPQVTLHQPNNCSFMLRWKAIGVPFSVTRVAVREVVKLSTIFGQQAPAKFSFRVSQRVMILLMCLRKPKSLEYYLPIYCAQSPFRQVQWHFSIYVTTHNSPGNECGDKRPCFCERYFRRFDHKRQQWGANSRGKDCHGLDQRSIRRRSLPELALAIIDISDHPVFVDDILQITHDGQTRKMSLSQTDRQTDRHTHTYTHTHTHTHTHLAFISFPVCVCWNLAWSWNCFLDDPAEGYKMQWLQQMSRAWGYASKKPNTATHCWKRVRTSFVCFFTTQKKERNAI